MRGICLDDSSRAAQFGAKLRHRVHEDVEIAILAAVIRNRRTDHESPVKPSVRWKRDATHLESHQQIMIEPVDPLLIERRIDVAKTHNV